MWVLWDELGSWVLPASEIPRFCVGEGMLGSLWLCQLNAPVLSPGTGVSCAVTNTSLHTGLFTALCSHSRSTGPPVGRFDVFLSQVMLVLTTLSVAEEMWHCLLFVLLRAIPLWVAAESRSIAAGHASLEQKMEICQTCVTSERLETLLIAEKTQ